MSIFFGSPRLRSPLRLSLHFHLHVSTFFFIYAGVHVQIYLIAKRLSRSEFGLCRLFLLIASKRALTDIVNRIIYSRECTDKRTFGREGEKEKERGCQSRFAIAISDSVLPGMQGSIKNDSLERVTLACCSCGGDDFLGFFNDPTLLSAFQ